MLLQKFTARNRPEAVSVPAECLSYQVTQLLTCGEEKTLEGRSICTIKQVKYMEPQAKSFTGTNPRHHTFLQAEDILMQAREIPTEGKTTECCCCP